MIIQLGGKKKPTSWACKPVFSEHVLCIREWVGWMGAQQSSLSPLASVCVPSLNRTKGPWPFKTPGDWSTEDWGTPQESPRVSSLLKTLRRLMQGIIYAQLRISEDRQQWLPLLSFPDLESEVRSIDGKPSVYTTSGCFFFFFRKKSFVGGQYQRPTAACGSDRHPKQTEVIRLLKEVLTFLEEKCILITFNHVSHFYAKKTCQQLCVIISIKWARLYKKRYNLLVVSFGLCILKGLTAISVVPACVQPLTSNNSRSKCLDMPLYQS